MEGGLGREWASAVIRERRGCWPSDNRAGRYEEIEKKMVGAHHGGRGMQTSTGVAPDVA